jgi:hypothetical protein
LLTKDNQPDRHFRRILVAMRSAITEEETMNSLFQAEEASSSTGKKVAMTIAILAVFGLLLWAGLQMALRLLSGR